MVNNNNMTPWHMNLVSKDVAKFRERRAVLKGVNHYRWDDDEIGLCNREVSDLAKRFLKEGIPWNSIHSLIGMELDYSTDDLYNVTLYLHDVSLYQQCNRSSETSRIYLFMAMAASNAYTLCHVYDLAVRTSVQHIQK